MQLDEMEKEEIGSVNPLSVIVAARARYGFLCRCTPFSGYYKGEHGKARVALLRALKAARATGALPEVVVAPLLRDITEKRTSDWVPFEVFCKGLDARKSASP